jgi:sec-independent protein translocase protein TatC
MDKKQPTYWDHLEDLRQRILVCLFIFLLFSVISFFVVDKILIFLKKPLEAYNITLNYFKPYEKFLTYIKVATLSGLILTIPFIFLQAGIFIYPALKEGERKIFLFFLFFSFFVFLGGLLFGYFVIFPMAIRFFVEFARNDPFNSLWGITSYIDMLSGIIIASGFVFQLPLILIFLIKMKILKVEVIVKYRKYVILLIAILASIFSPPDILSMFFVGIPLYLLFEISILLGRFFSK